MHLIRILTGRHAGSQLKLSRPHYVLGSQDDCDIQLTDWQGEPLSLLSGQHGGVLVMPASADGQFDPQLEPLALLADFQPLRLRGIALCTGPETACWPSDDDLMTRLVQGEAQAHTAQRISVVKRKALWGGGAAAFALLLVMLGLMLRTTHTAQANLPQVTLSQQVRLALAGPELESLVVRDAGTRVVVEGLLPDSNAMARTRSLLERFGRDAVVHKYGSASSLIQSITETLGNPALSVTYEGQGVFMVHGAAIEPERIKQATQRILGDLAPLVRRIDLAVAEAPVPSAKNRVGAVMAGDDMSYIQTSDGVKHITLPEASPKAEIAALPELAAAH